MNKGKNHDIIMRQLDNMVEIAGEMCGWKTASQRIDLARRLAETKELVEDLIYEDWSDEDV